MFDLEVGEYQVYQQLQSKALSKLELDTQF